MARVVKALGVKEVEKISKMLGVHAVGGVPGLALSVGECCGLRVRVDSSH